MLTQIDVVEFLILKCPGRTEIELAKAIHGPRAYQQLTNQDCSLLLSSGKAERRGNGGPGNPYRYYPLSDAT